MRGKVLELRQELLGQGITPAYAGKSQLPGKQHGSCGDHPRVCGEKEMIEPATRAPEGSPPRMQGKVPKQRTHGIQLGITPAYAGKS